MAVLSVGHAFAYLPAPVITSFSPAIGPVGTLVTINGTNLANPTAVNIGGKAAIVISNTGSALVCMVMPNSTTGTVSLTTGGGTATGGSNFTVTPTPYPYSQQGSKLVGTGNSGAAHQGYSISVSADGNTAIVGGYSDNGTQGAAWVYTRSGGSWSQQGLKLVGIGSSGSSQQGNSVSLSADGNTAIVGGIGDNGTQGAVWVYTRSGGSWSQQGLKLVGTGNATPAQQGWSVSLSADGNTAIVGAPADDSFNQGAAWVYTRSGGIWTQQGSKLVGTGNVGGANQGYSVSLSADGNTAIVGGWNDNGSQGAAWVYTRSGGIWTQQGLKLVGTGNVGFAEQGVSVSLSADGNTAMVGGYTDNTNQGAAWVYTRSGGIWTQQGSKLVGTGGIGARQGFSVSLSADGNTAIVGGNFDDSNQGTAWVYTRSGGIWTQQGLKRVGTGNSGTSQQGISVSLSADGNTAMVGGYTDNTSLGAAWAYTSTPTIPATNVTFTGTTTATTSASWTNGNGIARAVFISLATSGSPVPADGTAYIASTAYGSGTQIGSTGWYCVYNGTGTMVNITGLTAGTTYRVMAVEYNGMVNQKYLITAGTGNPSNVTTTFQGVTKNGNSTTTGTTFVNTNGKISGTVTLSKYGRKLP